MSGLHPLPFFIALDMLHLPPGTNLEAIMGSKNIRVYTWLYNTSIHSSLIKTILYLRVFTKTNDMFTYTHVLVIWMKSPLYYELVSVHAELRYVCVLPPRSHVVFISVCSAFAVHLQALRHWHPLFNLVVFFEVLVKSA